MVPSIEVEGSLHVVRDGLRGGRRVAIFVPAEKPKMSLMMKVLSNSSAEPRAFLPTYTGSMRIKSSIIIPCSSSIVANSRAAAPPQLYPRIVTLSSGLAALAAMISLTVPFIVDCRFPFKFGGPPCIRRLSDNSSHNFPMASVLAGSPERGEPEMQTP